MFVKTVVPLYGKLRAIAKQTYGIEIKLANTPLSISAWKNTHTSVAPTLPIETGGPETNEVVDRAKFGRDREVAQSSRHRSA